MAKPRSGQPRVHQRRCSRPRRQKGTWGGHVQLIATGAGVWVRRRFRLVNKGMNVTLRIWRRGAVPRPVTCICCHACHAVTVDHSLSSYRSRRPTQNQPAPPPHCTPRTRGFTSKKETGHTPVTPDLAHRGNGARHRLRVSREASRLPGIRSRFPRRGGL